MAFNFFPQHLLKRIEISKGYDTVICPNKHHDILRQQHHFWEIQQSRHVNFLFICAKKLFRTGFYFVRGFISHRRLVVGVIDCAVHSEAEKGW